MANSKIKAQSKSPIKTNNCPTIGLLTEGLSGEYQAGVWPGIADTARKENLNLICFTGGALSISPTEPWEYQRNVLYNIAEKSNLDGFIIAGSLGSYVSNELIIEFLKRYSHLPIVTLAPATESIPAIYVDNHKGMRDLITHLIEDHQYHKFAFIRGPEGNVEAEERFRLFQEVLEGHNIPIDHDCIMHGDFTRECGAEAVNQLYNTNKEIDVIVAADDETALGALQALFTRDKKVPEDVAVVGFDDSEESRYITPPLTTVRQPLYKLGKTAIEMLLKLLQGEKIPQNTILEARLIIRESCGCFSSTADVQELQKTLAESTPSANVLSEEDIFNHIMAWMDHSYAEYTREIVSCFCQSVNSKNGALFLHKVYRIGRDLVVKGRNLTAWHNIFFELWHYALSRLDKETFAFADDLLHWARVIRGDLGQRQQGYLRQKTIRENYFLREIGEILANTLNIEHLMDAINVQLPRLGINSFYLSMYEPGKKPGKKSRLMIAYVDGKRRKLGKEGVVFDTNALLPEDIISDDKLYTLVAEPLYFQKEQFGVILFEAGLQECWVYEVLRDYISGALHSTLLIRKIRQQTDVLAQANTELEKLREKEHAYLQAIKDELELGRKIQMGFLPQELPHPDGWEISVAFMPAREVSGDFYDAFMLGSDILALIIADVSGKDVSAALFMSLIRTLLRVFAEKAQSDGDDPLDAIDVVNDYIIQHHRQGDGRCMFATIFFGLLQPSTGAFTYINAGHNAPMILQHSTINKELSPTGPAVGLAADMEFNQKKTTIKPGEMLFTYTDGVTEAQSPEGDFFTLKRLIAILKQEYLSASEKVNQIKTALNEHIRGMAPFDDVTMLAVKRE